MGTVPRPKRAFYFVRHGETDYNREQRFQGSIDVPLNEIGRAQALRAAEIFSSHPVSRIVTSPARRARQTARVIAARGGQPMEIEPGLMEFSVGGFEGQRVDSIRREYQLTPEQSVLSVLPEDAEKWQQFVPRVCSAVQRWTERHDTESLLIASHGLVFRALAANLTGQDIGSGNGVAWLFQPFRDAWTVRELD